MVATHELISNAKTLVNVFLTAKFVIFNLIARNRMMRDQAATSIIVIVKMVDVFNCVTTHLKVSCSGQCSGLYVSLLTESMR